VSAVRRTASDLQRRSVPRRVGLGATAFAVALWIAPAGSAQEDAAGTSSRWTPGFAVGFDVQNQSLEAEFDSSFGIGGSRGSTILSSVFSFDASLRSPVLLHGAGAPRLVLHAGGQVPLSGSQSLLQVNKQYVFTDLSVGQFCPTGDPGIDSCDQSGLMEMTQDFGWYAGLGVEFTLPVSERQLRIRPSVDYFGQALRFEGQVDRIDRGPPDGHVVQTSRISASADELTHAIGPRLAFEVEAVRLGEFALNVFVEGQFFWIVSNRDFPFVGSNGGDSASFRAELDSLVSQGGAGLRIAWTGE